MSHLWIQVLKILSILLSLALNDSALGMPSASMVVGGTVISPKFESDQSLAVYELNIENGRFNVHCTGVAWQANTLLTSAHCIDQKEHSKISVKVTDLYGKKKSYKPTQIRIHPEFNPEKTFSKYDLALLTFDESIFSFQAEFIGSDYMSRKGDEVTVIGFGGNQYVLDEEEIAFRGRGIKRSGQNSIMLAWPDGRFLLKGSVFKETGLGIFEEAVSADGDSGAPVFNTQGQVIGIIVAGSIQATETDKPIARSYVTHISLDTILDISLSPEIDFGETP